MLFNCLWVVLGEGFDLGVDVFFVRMISVFLRSLSFRTNEELGFREEIAYFYEFREMGVVFLDV